MTRKGSLLALLVDRDRVAKFAHVLAIDGDQTVGVRHDTQRAPLMDVGLAGALRVAIRKPRVFVGNEINASKTSPQASPQITAQRVDGVIEGDDVMLRATFKAKSGRSAARQCGECFSHDRNHQCAVVFGPRRVRGSGPVRR